MKISVLATAIGIIVSISGGLFAIDSWSRETFQTKDEASIVQQAINYERAKQAVIHDTMQARSRLDFSILQIKLIEIDLESIYAKEEERELRPREKAGKRRLEKALDFHEDEANKAREVLKTPPAS